MEHKPYITKRILISASSSAVRVAQKNALLRAGFVIKASKGWVVRENPNGTTQKISKFKSVKRIPLDLD